MALLRHIDNCENGARLQMQLNCFPAGSANLQFVGNSNLLIKSNKTMYVDILGPNLKFFKLRQFGTKSELYLN